ncbi:PAS domain S-box protein [Hoeflea sp. TYP-13]|uniref:PAS domain S-box protein n=1 Tax=Hoeflea sp. TYP-13 TaxID=3230023 RepID=UPI0034C63FE3
MPTGQYPFIDIAVHDKVRARFAAGNALVLLSQSLDNILWVNGAGARLFGHEALYECMDEGLSHSTAAFRQIEAAARTVNNRPDDAVHSFVMRAGSGFRRPLLSAQMERIELSDGNRALLISAELGEAATTTAAMAASILDGFDGTDTHAAVLDSDGNIVDSTRSFARLGMGSAVRKQIVDDVADAADRLAKHPVPTALGHLPSAVARISDEPALHLLFTVEMPTTTSESASGASDDTEIRTQPKADPVRQKPARPVRRKAIEPAVPSVLNLAPESRADAKTPDGENTGANDPDASSTEEKATTRAAEPEMEPAASAKAAGKDARPIEDTDRPVESGEPSFVFDPLRRPMRFVWKIDAEGAFQEISREFAETVGPNAADVEGRKFVDVAQVFNIDPDHTISDLLLKRDTWSGKTVFWPVQGTDLRVPVDLAALPTYSREREFDGFRGFGIVRPGDAVSDPEQIGLALIDNADLTLDGVGTEAEGDAGSSDDIDQSAGKIDAADSGESTAETGDEHRDQSGEDPAGETATPKEKPALEITETPGRRHTDKVIRLEERRSRPRDGLSNHEKQAFREIAERLGGGKKPAKKDDAEPQQPFGKRQAPPEQNNDNDDALPDMEAEVPHEEIEPSDREPDVFETSSTQPEAESDVAATADDESGEERDQRGNVVTPAVLEQLPTPIIVHDGTTIFYINEEFRQLTGHLTKTELNEAGGMPALFDNDGGSDDKAAPSGGMVLRAYDGGEISVRAKLRSIGWEDGHALMLALEALPQQSPEDEDDTQQQTGEPDVTDEADGEQVSALQVEVDELRSILETATDGVVLIGEDGIIRSMNKSASALFDFDENETTGRPFAMLFAHESQRAVKDYLSGLTGNGVASVLNDGREVIGREASGGFLPLFMTIGHLSGSNGYCAVMRDITQWKRAEEELRAAKREAETASSHKSEFLARVSHEIRTPLNAIIGFSELMAEERFGPIGSPRYVEYAHDIGRSGKHVLEIVNDLLDISKIEAGEQDLDFGAVSLNDALLDAISILQPQANTQRVIVRTSLSSSVPEVVADKRSIKQIAINILSNAIRFTPAGGQVVVSTTYEPSGNVSLRIRDTGVGMTRFQLEQAMKPFKQVAGFHRQRGEGTGLGLPLAKAMAEANRAQFAMNSQPGQGTLVEIVFPSQRVLAE